MTDIPPITTASRRKLSRTRSASDLIREKALRRINGSPNWAPPCEDKNARVHLMHSRKVAHRDSVDKSKQKRIAERQHNKMTRNQLFFTPHNPHHSRRISSSSSIHSSSSHVTEKCHNKQTQQKGESPSSSITEPNSVSITSRNREEGPKRVVHFESTLPDQCIKHDCHENLLLLEEDGNLPRYLECEEPPDDESVLNSMMDCSHSIHCHVPSLLSHEQRPPHLPYPQGMAMLNSSVAAQDFFYPQYSERLVAAPFSARVMFQPQGTLSPNSLQHGMPQEHSLQYQYRYRYQSYPNYGSL